MVTNRQWHECLLVWVKSSKHKCLVRFLQRLVSESGQHGLFSKSCKARRLLHSNHLVSNQGKNLNPARLIRATGCSHRYSMQLSTELGCLHNSQY